MEIDSGVVIILTVLIVSAFLLIVFKLAEFFAEFNRNTRYILLEMNRAADSDEYRYWRRELRCHYLCLIPFVNERNVMQLYHRLYHRSKHAEKKRSDGLSHLLAPSVIGACICAVCLCGASWAWFTASSSAGTAKIQAASYTVSVTAVQGESQLSANTAENGASIFALEADKEYTIEITPTGNATTGYCKVNFESKDYYTVQLPSGTLLFTVYASNNGKLTVTPEWGTCAIASEDNAIEDGGKIGTEAALTNTSADTAESTDQEPQPIVPTDATPTEETTSAPDAPTALPESSANEE